MINKKDFEKLIAEVASYDAQRELLIKKSRDVLKLSKQLIYSLHRNNIKEAENIAKRLQKEKNDLDKLTLDHKGMDFEGSYSEALQEFAEALCYYEYIKNKKIPSNNELRVDAGAYLGGISDLTGELTRKAVLMVIAKDFKKVEEIKELVEEIHGLFLKMDLRNSNLRKKADAIKWNLKKLEDVMYDVKMRYG